MAGCNLLPSSTLLGSSRFLQLLQRRAEEKRKHHFPLQTKTNTHSGMLIQHESVECREMSGGSHPTASGWAQASEA